MTEATLQRSITKALNALGIHVIRSRMDRRATTQAGTPDLIFAHRGIPYALEVKTAKGKCSPAQLSTHFQMGINGWRVAVVRDLQAAIDFVQTNK
jgi:hypothetical protein